MERTRRTKGRLAALATPLVTASLALALSACGGSEPTSSAPPAASTGANTGAHPQQNGSLALAVQTADDPVTITVTPAAVCAGKPVTITATVGGTFKPGTIPMRVVGTVWDIRIYDEEGGLTGLPTTLNSGRSRTLEFNWSSRVPGVYVLFADVYGAPGSAGQAMTWFVVLPEFACDRKPPPDPTPSPSGKPQPSTKPYPSSKPQPSSSPQPPATPQPSSKPQPTPKPQPTSTAPMTTPRPTPRPTTTTSAAP
jgi:hypothetical protein